LSSQIELLAALQRVDQSLGTNTKAVDAGKARVAALDAQLATKGALLATAQETVAGLERRQREMDARLSDIETKMKDRRMRIARIRNEKELGLIRREIELLKEENGAIETEGLAILEQIETGRAAVEALSAEHAQLQAERAQESGELEATIARVAEAIEMDQTRRDELLRSVDESLHRRYELIFSRRDGLAVVEVSAGTCRGCHMNLPPQLYNQVQRNEQIHLCPSCQRILYWQPGDDGE
jgi:predicted  nucleic acid-binding Zn-ribbon protein